MFSKSEQPLDAEKQALLQDVQPRLMRYGDISRAADTVVAALENDPLFRYALDLPVGEHTPFSTKMAVKLESMFLFSREIRLKTALTVADGDASVRFADPMRPPDTIDKIISSILAPIGKLIKLTHSHERKKRYKEMQTKTDNAIEKSIGERRHEMFVIASLMTHPAKQGRGYGTALVKAVTEQADAMGRATWLHSSNTKANTGFYRSLGFVTVAESVIGDDNPNWKGGPFVTAIMVREPLQQSAGNTSLLNTRAGEAA